MADGAPAFRASRRQPAHPVKTPEPTPHGALLPAVRRFICRALALGVAMLPGIACGATLVAAPAVEAVSGTNAVVRWSTDVATGARVRYGTALSNLTQSAAGEVRAQHAVALTGLRPGTKYFYTVGTARGPLATNSFTTPGPAGVAATAAEAKLSKPGPGAQATAPRAPPTRQTWGNVASLRDHFERHGADFTAKDADDYARQAWEFLQRARAEGLPAKVDEDGVIRVFDPKSRAFAAYNRDGTTKTFFKPNSRDYFERQPGQPVNAKTLKF
jgi:hypothetical protein